MEGQTAKTILQLKIDYLEFMEQMLDWFEPTFTGVLFALLLEQDYLTQEEIMKLTGFSRGTVSETLNQLTDITSKYPVLQTRKPDKKQKYYYCPLDFKEYMKRFIASSLELATINLDFLPQFLYRINQLNQDNPEVQYVKGIFDYYISVTELFCLVIDSFKGDWEKQLGDRDYKKKFIDQLKIKMSIIKDETSKKEQYIEKKDSLHNIKKDFITFIQELYSSVGRKREFGAVLLALFLERGPVTQDDLIATLGYSRSTISEALTELMKVQIVKVIKKPKDRKKYYQPAMDLNSFAFLRIERMKRIIDKIMMVLENKFLTEINGIKNNKTEKERLKTFFKENIQAYQLLKEYSLFHFNAVQEILKKEKEEFIKN
ncbi:MAG: hypothetical protein GF308_09530 [Candidatus Heimdallarchaeota archaeon]|nr:hypothetical protein [Candidatus Heimdallarchaeota archaeon]